MIVDAKLLRFLRRFRLRLTTILESEGFRAWTKRHGHLTWSKSLVIAAHRSKTKFGEFLLLASSLFNCSWCWSIRACIAAWYQAWWKSWDEGCWFDMTYKDEIKGPSNWKTRYTGKENYIELRRIILEDLMDMQIDYTKWTKATISPQLHYKDDFAWTALTYLVSTKMLPQD